MNITSSIILGFLQGLTEFFPVSSSGHLVLVQSILPGFSQPGVLFDVTLHLGTLLAVVIYFRKQLLKLNFKYIVMLVIGTLPAVFIGLVFGDAIEGLFTSVKLVGLMLILTGLMNYATDLNYSLIKDKVDNWIFALIVGLFQAFAIIPGVSRSGSTIFAGSKLGMDKKDAAKFSFLLSVPAVFGANVYEVYKLGNIQNIDVLPYLVGFLSSFIVGYFSIIFVLQALSRSKFKYFAYYCFLLGIVVIFL